jgi:hypothetical protein
MSAPQNPELPQIEIGLDGHLTLIGECKGIATVRVQGLAFVDNKLATQKIAESFRGTCIFTNPLGTNEPCFIFTVNAGEVVRKPHWFLSMVRNKLLPIVTEVDLMSRN